jgi:hypothetical protein
VIFVSFFFNFKIVRLLHNYKFLLYDLNAFFSKVLIQFIIKAELFFICSVVNRGTRYKVIELRLLLKVIREIASRILLRVIVLILMIIILFEI